MNNKDKDNNVSARGPGSLLIFVLGAPCAGKSTLCETLAQRYDLDHFSIGTELRSLISSSPTGHAARLKPHFTPSELSNFKRNVLAGTLGDVNQTPKYVKERIFPSNDSIDRSGIRILIDGFPRGVDRWTAFKDAVKDRWRPDEKTMVILLKVKKDLARERFVSRGRAGDEFEKRFDDWEGKVGDIEWGMRDDGVCVLDINVGDGIAAEDVVRMVERTEFWRAYVARGIIS